MPEQRPGVHRIAIVPILPAESGGKAVEFHIPARTVAELRRAYPAGQLRCGSCGHLMPLGDMSKLERKWGPDTVVMIELSHDYFPVDPSRVEQASTGERQTPAQSLVLYSDGIREEYVPNGDGRYELLYGTVYRDAASLTKSASLMKSAAPARVYREVWYPTAVFRAPEEVPNAPA